MELLARHLRPESAAIFRRLLPKLRHVGWREPGLLGKFGRRRKRALLQQDRHDILIRHDVSLEDMSGVLGSIAEDAGRAAGVGLMRHWRLQYRAGMAGLGIACCLALLCVGKPTPAHSTGAPAPQLVVAHHCLAIDSSHAVVLQLASPDDGLLRVEVEEHGNSTVSLLNDVDATSSASPIERLGTVVLAAKVQRGELSKVAVRVDDSRDLRGEICVSAELISPRDILRTQAELDFSAGGRATQRTEWAAAFSRYLSAARRFDHLGLRFSAASARHALAELAYLRFDRKRDSYA